MDQEIDIHLRSLGGWKVWSWDLSRRSQAC